MNYTVKWSANIRNEKGDGSHVLRIKEEYEVLDKAVSFLKTLPKVGTELGDYRISFVTWTISCEDYDGLPWCIDEQRALVRESS